VADIAEKRWYIRDHIGGQPRQIWLFHNQTATRMGVTNPEKGPGTFFKAEVGEDFLDCIRRQTSWLDPRITEGGFYLATLGPGEYYPRIARPLALATAPTLWSPSVSADKAYVGSSRSQLTSLIRKLETICQTIHPSEKNLGVYGHETRNLLILAATEAEMHFRGILNANGSSAKRFNSNDYIRLIEPLKLLDYIITFHDFPDLPPVRAFAGWSKSDPTESLGWYSAYNGVKHNREGEFDRGTLRRALEAMSACIALQVAQFGPTALNFELSSTMALEVPEWAIGDMYLSPMTSPNWSPVHHPDL
jgi:hypothetical protein